MWFSYVYEVISVSGPYRRVLYECWFVDCYMVYSRRNYLKLTAISKIIIEEFDLFS